MNPENKNLIPNEDLNYEEDINEQPTFCNMCQEFPEEYIALSCSHNFCLICLTKWCLQTDPPKLIKSENKNKEIDSEEDYILCPIDNQATPLNKTSIEALNKMKDSIINGEIKKKPVYNEVIFEESAENFHTTDEFPKKKGQKIMNAPLKSNVDVKEPKTIKNSPATEEKLHYLDKNFNSAKEIATFTYNSPLSNKRKNMNPQISFCAQHKSEESIIICFTCGNKPLCVQCIVNGDHKNHEMANLTKIKENCKEALNYIVPEIEKKKNEFDSLIEKLNVNKKNISDKIWEIKSKISQDFSELKQRLTNKENELLLLKDFEASEKFSQIDSHIQSFQHKIYKMQEFQDNLCIRSENSETLADGFELFTYFNENKQEIFDLFSFETSNILQEAVNLKVDVDKKSFVNYLECIHNLQLATTNLYDIEEKMRSSQNFFKQNSLKKINFEKSLLLHESVKENTKENSLVLREEEDKFKPLNLIKTKEKTTKIFESPFKNGPLTNSSFNLSFVNDNTKIKSGKWANKSLVKKREPMNNDPKISYGMNNFLKQYENKLKLSGQKNNTNSRIFSLEKALEKQKETFLKKKEFFFL